MSQDKLNIPYCCTSKALKRKHTWIQSGSKKLCILNVWKRGPHGEATSPDASVRWLLVKWNVTTTASCTLRLRMIDGDIENQVMNISAHVVQVYNFINVHSLKHASKSSVISEGKQLKTFYTHTMNRQMHIYKYVQSYIILHQHVSATLMTINRVLYNSNTIGIQITVQKCMLRPLTITFNILKWISCS